MDYQQLLLSKNGLAALRLAREFLKYQVGTKIPTVTDMSEKLDIGRGTLQSSLSLLQTTGALKLESRGHMGTYLVKKNTLILLEIANITSIVGAMPLPYSKKYEGFASGLIVAMENHYNIPVSMAYMRGARNRISMLLTNRYDYAVVSKYAADEFMKTNDSIVIVKSFGPHSYLSEHVVIFNNPKAKTIEDGMRVGIDVDSIDQKELTEEVCRGKKVDFIPVDYSQILSRVIEGDIDAAVWNKDEVTDKIVNINYVSVKTENVADTEAVIVVRRDKEEIISLLNEIIDIETVMNIQKLVLEGKITPSY
ncbi:GntR family transcriptional regulator YhfZ [Anaerorhabdus sp.]|uniref:GntR family transcriptional regulator YhfZ n=1 Tax=Anaerorhabdus sp. TaxID=1872524 RepID=UPI002B21B916|nr:GntR family transcriptional regulator YhfZ [Anaerorhabdus sp.]MEA4874527.1 GntR family transcriptional regulator YhfZ [Anaerorhabdus sp.]